MICVIRGTHTVEILALSVCQHWEKQERNVHVCLSDQGEVFDWLTFNDDKYFVYRLGTQYWRSWILFGESWWGFWCFCLKLMPSVLFEYIYNSHIIVIPIHAHTDNSYGFICLKQQGKTNIFFFFCTNQTYIVDLVNI